MFHKLALSLLLASLPLPSASHLRPRRNLQTPSNLECTILVGAIMGVEGSVEGEEFFDCEMDPEDMNGISGITLPIKASEGQKNKLKEKLNNGQLVSGKSTLKLSFDTGVGKDGLHLPPGLEIAFGERRDRRNLAIVEGDKPILVVKVIDSLGLQRPESLAEISDDIFGTGSDTENLKSQMAACSHGKLNVVPGQFGNVQVPSAVGIIEVNIDVSLQAATSNSQVHNAVTIKAQEILGHSLPGPYQQVMYVVENCYHGDCGWAAYAYVNSWMSVYKQHYYKQSAIQMHEIGHNLNLAHSGGLDGATYTDHTGAMGNPCYKDDGCKLCFNAAKNWQLGWYNDKTITVDPRSEPTKTVKLVGIADYSNNPDGHSVIIKIETGSTTDQYIGFNRATGANINNDEADDEVTITETGANGAGYSLSSLKAHLVQGESHLIPNWAGTGETLYITATAINNTVNPWYATVDIQLGLGCTSDLDCDDGIHCNGAETCDVSTGVCQAGAPVVCDDGLFCNGVETCSEGTSGPVCAPGTDPCDDGLYCNGIETCNEDLDTCVAGVAIDCDNGIFCDGVESCVEGAGSHVCQPGAPHVCQDDGNACNGVASCDVTTDQCVTSPAVDCSGQNSVCGAQKICQPSTGLCVDDITNFGPDGQNGVCDLGESCTTCPDDCTFSFGSGGATVCGNGVCEEGEDWLNCSLDCNSKDKGQVYFCSGGPDGDCSGKGCNADGFQCINTPAESFTCCGDGICELGEDQDNCAQDCDGSSGGCGDGTCGAGEDAINCPADCGLCGNAICDNGEDYDSCPGDCKCGDGVCDANEDSINCSLDCSPDGCPICSATGLECCGTCVEGGKPANRGCFV